MICDEAHRTANWSSKDKLAKFSLCNDNKKIPTLKCLYMTATPKVVNTNKIQKEKDDGVFCMNDPNIYGEELYYMSFKEAIEQNLLVDYQIVVFGLNNDEYNEYLKDEQNINLEEGENAEDVIQNIILNKFFEKYKIDKAITFHNTIKKAQLFDNRHQKLYPKTKSYHINGSFKADDREEIFTNFKKDSPSIITNSRCLSEGIDIPSIDAVYFCNKKTSKIDIVQAAGRALRKDPNNPNKKMGYIIIPLQHSKQENTKEAIEKSPQFKEICNILIALKEQDDRLKVFINKRKDKQENTQNISIDNKQEIERELIVVDGFETGISQNY